MKCYSNMKINYWIIKLKLPTLWRIVRKKTEPGYEKGMLTYIYSGKCASMLLKYLAAHNKMPFGIEKIQDRESVSGPILHLHNVRDDENRLLIMKIYHHVLNIRRTITERLLDKFKSYPYFIGKNPFNHVTACIGFNVAEKLNNTIYMAYYAKWKYYNLGVNGEDKNILIMPRTDWDDILIPELNQLVHQVEVESDFSGNFGQMQILVKSLFRSIIGIMVHLFRTNPEKRNSEPFSFKDCKIMTYYAMGVEKGKRNDIGFIHEGNLPTSRLALFCRYPTMVPSEEEMKWIEANGVVCYGYPGVSRAVPRVKPWISGKTYSYEMGGFYGVYLRTLLKGVMEHKKGFGWLGATIWEMGKKTVYWKDFFIHNHIGMVINSIPALENFIPNMALSEIGGISINLERSILFDYCTYIHNPPGHIYFITGPYSLLQIPEPSLSLYTLRVGSVNTEDSEEIEGIDALRGENRKVIALFDELPNDVFFGESIREFYGAFIELAEADDRFSLLIKTKKPQVLESMPDEIRNGIQRLMGEGRCMQAGWKITAPTAAAQSDMVAAVPSTAAFESILAGTRTILYNPMRTGSSPFYRENGLNRRVFEDSGSMIDALKRFADGTDEGVGDCGDLIPYIDSFNDKKGPERVGMYLQTCFDLFDEGKSRDEIIETANANYTQKWGSELLTSDKTYEINL